QNRFAGFQEILQTVYTLEELELRSEEIFADGNYVCYHESFLDNTELAEEAAQRRKELEKFAKKHRDFILVIFSGSKGSRTINTNVVHMPVSDLYNNLEIFLGHYANGDKRIEYLMYGDNPDIENKLIEELEKALLNLEHEPA